MNTQHISETLSCVKLNRIFKLLKSYLKPVFQKIDRVILNYL